MDCHSERSEESLLICGWDQERFLVQNSARNDSTLFVSARKTNCCGAHRRSTRITKKFLRACDARVKCLCV